MTDAATATAPAKRSPRNRAMGTFSPLADAQHHLDLNDTDFSIALGYTTNIIADWRRKNAVPKTAILAAEALVRRQGRSAVIPQKKYFFFEAEENQIKALSVFTADELQAITIAGTTFYLVPRGNAPAPRHR